MRVAVIQGIESVSAAQWDRLIAPHDTFTEHAFLLALERTGCVGAQAGWLPCHVVAYDDANRLCGAVPLYLKDNSFGEYIFDWGWAEAAEAAGLRYYPKLVAAVPFTPVTGRRMLMAGTELEPLIVEALISGVKEVAERTEASSIHWLFVTAEEQRVLSERFAYLSRLSQQFHWHNDGYTSFEDYCGAFRSSVRKQVRRERNQARRSGLRFLTVCGEQIDQRQWQALYEFYVDTTSRKWGRAYLTAEFFREMPRTFGQRALATLALEGDRPVAGTLNFQRGGRLYGRYWGCLREHDALHFELCYYRLIEYCIDHGFQHFEAGAQGLHKLRRGLMPTLTYSAHWFRHAGLHHAVQRFVEAESGAVKQEIAMLNQHGPFRR